MMTSIALIESNTSGTGRLFVTHARRLGLTPVLITRNPDRFDFVGDEKVQVISADTRDQDAVVNACETLGPGLIGVTTSSEFAAPMAALVARALALPGPDPEAIAAARDKHHQRSALAQAGVDEVRSFLVQSTPDAKRAATTIGYPVVLKPRGQSGSTGVRLCRSPAAVEAQANLLLQGTSEGFLVEECLRGAEFSAEVFDGTVVGITRKYLGPPPSFVEVGHDYPAPLPADQTRRIHAFIQNVVEALGLTFGPVHVEFREDGQACHLIEANPRLAGGFIPELVRHATGIDLIEATLLRSIGQTPVLAPFYQRGAAIRFVVPEETGILRALNFRNARHLPGVVAALAYRPIGATVGPIGDFSDRIGHVLAVGETTTDAGFVADGALAAVELAVHKPVKFAGARS